MSHPSEFVIIPRESLDELMRSAGKSAHYGIPASDALVMVAEERHRQIHEEGFTADHDDQWCRGELSRAASQYIRYSAAQIESRSPETMPTGSLPVYWPLHAAWWKPSSEPALNIVKGAALAVAQLERQQRLHAAEAEDLLKPEG